MSANKTKATLGQKGRQYFNKKIIELLEANETPSTMKVSWNKIIEGLTQ